MDKAGLTPILLTSTVISFFSAGVFGSFGAIVQFLYLVVKGQHNYSFIGLMQFSIMGFFVGMVTNELVFFFTGEVYPGVVLVSGFIFMKILDFFNGSKLGDLVNLFVKR